MNPLDNSDCVRSAPEVFEIYCKAAYKAMHFGKQPLAPISTIGRDLGLSEDQIKKIRLKVSGELDTLDRIIDHNRGATTQAFNKLKGIRVVHENKNRENKIHEVKCQIHATPITQSPDSSL